MQVWQEDQLQTLAGIDSAADVMAKLAKIARGLGFEYCSVGLRLPLPVSNPRVVAISNYPDAWQQRYREKHYFSADPTVRHALSSVVPLIWSQEVFSASLELREEARSYGIAHGWARPSRDGRGVMSLLTAARSAEPLTDAELQQKSHALEWLSQAAHIGMSDVVVPKQMPEAVAPLTQREIAVLRWSAEGKTSEEVAEIMNLSSRTVNFHLNNAVVKLGANNKTAAAVRAAVLGLLH